jgi:serine/alanine adding enzyme
MLMSTRKYRFEIVDSDHDAWDSYVQQHPSGSIFHTRAMIRAFQATGNIQPRALAAIDESGELVALLVSCHVKTLRDFSSFSSRSVHYAEPLCDPTPVGMAALQKLLKRHDEHMRDRSLLCEVRSICEPGRERDALLQCGYDHRDYINYIVELDTSVEELWSRVNKNLRQKIRGTFRKEIELRDDNSVAGVERLYRLLQSSYGRARVPLMGRDLFEAALEHLPAECVRIRTAFDGDKPIASIMSLLYGGRVFSWYGGTLRIAGLSPFACLVWDDIRWGVEHGFGCYDFGGAGWPHEDYGPRKFKASFGGTEVRYGRYLLTYSKLRLRLAEMAYGVSRRLGAWSGSSSQQACQGLRND